MPKTLPPLNWPYSNPNRVDHFFGDYPQRMLVIKHHFFINLNLLSKS